MKMPRPVTIIARPRERRLRLVEEPPVYLGNPSPSPPLLDDLRTLMSRFDIGVYAGHVNES